MNNNQPSLFTCITCGGHDLTVTHTWNVLAGADSESWPDLKYANVWQQKGRLRAGHLQVETTVPKILS